MVCTDMSGAAAAGASMHGAQIRAKPAGPSWESSPRSPQQEQMKPNAIPDTSTARGMPRSRKKPHVSLFPPQSRDLKVPPRPSKSRGAPAVLPGLFRGLRFERDQRCVLGVVSFRPPLHAGAPCRSYYTFPDLGLLFWVSNTIWLSTANPACGIWHDSVSWSMLLAQGSIIARRAENHRGPGYGTVAACDHGVILINSAH